MSREFVCAGCKRTIFVFVEPGGEPPVDRCAHCLFHPGWTADPTLIAIFDGAPPLALAGPPRETEGRDAR
jgi:hypothetical protein